jgi:fatty acid desaturase
MESRNLGIRLRRLFLSREDRFAEEMRHADGQLLARDGKNERIVAMLWTLAVILVVLWALGMITSHAAGGLLHILLVVALVVVVIRLLQGRRPLT